MAPIIGTVWIGINDVLIDGFCAYFATTEENQALDYTEATTYCKEVAKEQLQEMQKIDVFATTYTTKY
eukprot:CAMPEP_0170492388 /NCGR_PEP_ID=MMETSP0208-20121228/12164_1 /TAXON_ID=197538 /ORGANISM="Strombidium inclinatum, Strain S3" /LENGTH=67 /DNA_ID=CAMNT_0010768121 /DNA_START=202 /DNA_END=405 /DNA_ORIENTATION=+